MNDKEFLAYMSSATWDGVMISGAQANRLLALAGREAPRWPEGCWRTFSPHSADTLIAEAQELIARRQGGKP